MSTAILERVHFDISRAVEYFDQEELAKMTGQPVYRFAAVALKELMDNALDAAETAGRPPKIDIEVRCADERLLLSVSDNGAGIPADVVRRILNFDTRTSDKAAYRAPTRGAQGNALKTVLGMPCTLGERTPILIEAAGVLHRIAVWVDPAGELRVEHEEKPDPLTAGTCVSLTLPAEGQELNPERRARVG